MRVLAISDKGELLPLARRIQLEGHSVVLHINDPVFSTRGRGHVDERTSYKGPLCKGGKVATENVLALLIEVKPDLVLLDKGMGPISEVVRKWGGRVWGADRWGTVVNNNAPYGNAMMDFAEINNAEIMTRLAKVCDDENIQIKAGAWWNGEELLYHHVAIYEMGFMNDGAGLRITGAVLVHPISQHTRLSQQLLSPLTKMLKRVQYQGPITIGTKLEVGYDLAVDAALGELVHGEFTNAAKGKHIKVVPQDAVALRISLPPYPSKGEQHIVRDVKVEEGAERHVWLVDATNHSSAGITGELGWVSARGDKDWPYHRRIYRTIDRLDIQSLQYRTDVGRHAEYGLSALRSMYLI